MIIMKFGGTSVQDAEAIERVISIVRDRLRDKPLVVVSALSKVTRLLCSIAEEAEAQHEDNVRGLLSQLRERHLGLTKRLFLDSPGLLENAFVDVENLIKGLETFVGGVCLIGELSPRSKARIISTGELLSSTIIGYAFNAKGISCQWIDARRMVITDDNYMNARPDLDVTVTNVKRIIGAESKGVDIVLTQGFVASTESGAPSVLGFEGSDYSAAIFGMALGARRVEIWTDVDGIRTADPMIVPDTGKIDIISYEEAAEMAAMGARVLHPLTIEPARKKNIPILVLNSRNPECGGSLVVRGDNSPEGPKSVAVMDDILLVRIVSSKQEGVTRMFGKVFAALYPRRTRLVLAKATESEVYLVASEETRDLTEALDEIGKWAEVTVYRDKALISVIGRNIVGFEGLGDKVINLAGKICMADVGANMMRESFVIDRDRLADALCRVHDFIFKK